MFHQIWNQAMYTSNAVRDLANVYYIVVAMLADRRIVYMMNEQTICCS